MPTVLSSQPTYSIGAWSTNVIDANGVTWGISSQGSSYYDGPGVRLNQSAKPYGPGGFRTRSFRDIRVITLTGWLLAPDPVSALNARATLLGLFPRGSQQTLTLADALSTRTALVELVGTKCQPLDACSFTWQLSLSLVDPRFYDQTTQSATTTLPSSSGGLDWVTGGGLNWSPGLNWGTVTSTGIVAATNTGNAETWPTFTLVGPLGAPTITNNSNGGQLTFNQALNTGDTLVISCSPFNRSVLLNGGDRRATLAPAQWPSIPEQSTVIFALSAASGTGSLTATWQSANW